MKKIVLIAGIALAVIVVVAVAGYIAVRSFLTPAQLRSFTQKMASDAIKQPVEIGAVSLKIGFKIGIAVDDVRLSNPAGFPAGPMLSVDRLSMNLKLLPLLRRRIVIGSMDVDGLNASVIRNQGGQVNLVLLVPKEAAGPANAWALSLSTINLHRATVAYQDEATRAVYNLREIDERISFRDKSISADGDLLVVIPAASAAPELKVKIKNDCTFDTLSKDLSVKTFNLENEAIRVRVSGRIAKLDQADLKADAQVTDLAKVLPMLPPKSRPRRLAGSVKAKLDITGPLANPQLRGRAELNAIAVEMPGLAKPIDNVTGVLTFDGNSISSIDIRGQLAALRFTISGGIHGFKTPLLDLKVAAQGDLKDLEGLATPNQSMTMSGPLTVSAAIKGPAANPSYSGDVTITNGVLNGVGFAQPLSNFKFRGALQNNAIRVNECAGMVGRSDFNLTGTISDFKKPVAQVVWTSKLIDLDEMLPKPKPGAAQTGPPLPLIIQGSAKINQLIGMDMEFKNVATAINYNNGIVDLKDCNADAFDGRVRFDLYYNFNSPEPYRINSRMENLSTQKVFKRFFKCELIEGRLNGAGNFQGNGFTSTKAISNLSASGNVKLNNGTFRSFPFMTAMLGWMGFKDQQNMPFEDWTCSFKITNGKVNADNWALATSMGNFLFNGTLGLTGAVNMNVTATLTKAQSDLLKKYHADWLLYYDPSGRAIVDALVSGKISAPNFALDKQKIQDRLKGRIKDEFDAKKKEFEQKLKDLWKKK